MTLGGEARPARHGVPHPGEYAFGGLVRRPLVTGLTAGQRGQQVGFDDGDVTSGANHHDPVMTSHLAGVKPGSVARAGTAISDVRFREMTWRHRTASRS